MLPNYFEIKLIPKAADSQAYNVQLNKSALDILSLIFEFKLAGGWHISRFIRQQNQNKYAYLRLRRMWQAGLLESFKVGTGFVYYMLSKEGLEVLEDSSRYHPGQLSQYPKAKAFLSGNLFQHEAQVVELASMEAHNNSKELNITFKGELSSQGIDYRSGKTIEAFTPDYTVYYTFNNIAHCIYTEFERTQKSKAAMVKKLRRYLYFLDYEQREDKIMRIIFQTQAMEQSFWLNVFMDNYTLLQSLKIITTNLSVLKNHKQFFEPVYVTEQTLKLTKPNSLGVDISRRMRLFEWV